MRWLPALALVSACGRDAAPPPEPPPLTAPPRLAVVPPDAPPPAVDAGVIAVAAACPDPIAGLWVGRFFENDHWNEFRVELRRQGGQLTCAQETRWWDAPADAVRPPTCAGGGPAWGVTSLRCEAALTSIGLEVRTVTVLSEHHTCGGATGNYIDDWFRGPVDGNTWIAPNRFEQDGAWIEQPTTFRRLGCAP
ncbi:MAG: hypothetical protein IPL61_35760 [Myxococcales bacterium]|nr:hypothetical protein [Myxococcales bacterium]